MALICDVELSSGLEVNNAYLRIISFSGTEVNLSFNLYIYVDKDSYKNKRTPLTSETHEITFDKDRYIFRKAYGYLQALDKYKDAVEA